MKLIENNIQKIIALCKKHKVGKLFVFGSILTNHFNEKSDVDMVIDFDKVNLEDYADNYFDFKYSLEDKAIRNPILQKNYGSRSKKGEILRFELSHNALNRKTQK